MDRNPRLVSLTRKPVAKTASASALPMQMNPTRQTTPNVLFLSTSIGHRTFRKTVRMIEEAGASVLLIGFSRGKYPESVEPYEIQEFDVLEHGHYARRVLQMIGVIRNTRKLVKKFDYVHVFSLDSLILSRLSSAGFSISLIYQVQDIRPTLIGKGFKARVARAVERALLNKVSHVVVSSAAFLTEHFERYYNMQNITASVIENKLEYDPMADRKINEKLLPANYLRIGYFGVLRCPRSWEILVKAVNLDANDSTELFVRGIPSRIPCFDTDIERSSHIHYGGPYRDPDDLDELYSNIDIVWAAYPYGHGLPGNWQMARTVRFYEAGAYGIPVIVQAGTQDAQFVQQHEIGLVVDMADVDAAIESIHSITSEQLKLWQENIRSLPRTTFIHSDEYMKLLDQITAVVNR